MSFDSEYLELRRKRKKKEDELKNKITNKKETKIVSAPNSTVKSTVTGPSASTVKRNISGPSKLRDERDIAPVMKTFEPKKTTVTALERKSTAIAKAILGTAGDLGMNAASGAVGHIEGITDAVGYGAADIADKIGKGSLADRIREKTKESFTQKLFGDAIKTYGEHSLSGDFTDSVAQGIGQVGTSILGGALSGSLLGGLGIGKRAVEKAVSAITTGATAMSGFGSGVGQAYEGRATDEEAKKYGMIAGASEALTELLFGGMGKVSKALGHSKGLLSLDDMLAKKVSNIFSNQIVKNIAEFGVKSSAEGFEEVLAGMAQAVGKKITYMKDEDLKKILKDEKLLEQYLVGMTTSAIMQSGDLTKAIADKTDFITGLDQNEQKVVDKAVENRIAEAEKDGKKLSNKDKDKIYDEVRKALDEGDIDTDVIESVLGGETYKKYKDTADNEAALKKEFDTLNKMKQGDMTGEQTDRRAELKEQLEEIKNSSKASQLKSQLSNEVSNLVKDSRLNESYNEKARRRETFTADLTKYDEKQKETVKKAVESGILNNTRRTHRFVDFIAKISADKGVSFDFTSNEKLKESGFAIKGKTVNGLVTKDGIQINVNSAKVLNTVVGHEVTHIFEGTELYPEIQRIVKEVAVKKGEYQSRYDEITELYKDIEDADIEKELTADLVGDYLFSDEDFIRRLSTENRSVFDKIRDEIKYLCRVATAGSAEARKLEQAKKLFEKVYREAEAKINTADEGGVIKYSLMNDVPFEDNVKDIVNMTDEVALKNKEQGNFIRVMNKTPSVILENVKDAGDYEVIIRFDALYLASRKEGVLKGNYHNLGKDIITKLPEFIEDPDAIVRMNDGRLNLYTTIKTPKGSNGIISMEMNAVKDINSKNDKYNLVVTVFSAKDNYIKNKLAENGVKIEYKKEDLSQVNHQLHEWLATVNDKSSANSIPNSTENVKQKGVFSLSSPDTAPKKYGNYNVYGEDVMLEGKVKSAEDPPSAEISAQTAKKEITAPTRESIGEGKKKVITDAPIRADLKPLKNEQVEGSEAVEPVEATVIKTVEDRITAKIENSKEELSKNQRLLEESNADFDRRIAEAQAEYDSKKNKNTKVANNILRRIETLKRRKNNIAADYSKRISDIEASITRKEGALSHYREGLTKEQADRLEKYHRRTERRLEADKKALDEEYAEKKAALQEEVKDKNAFISRRAKELYDEKNSMRKGVRVSRKLGYLLDLRKEFGVDWEEFNSVIFRVSRHPNAVIDVDSEMEAAVRVELNNEFQDRTDELKQLDTKLAEEKQKLEEDADKAFEKFERANRRMTKQKELEEQMAELIGDTSTWKDKKYGLQYKVNTLKRNLREVVRDADGKRDIAKADRIYYELQGKYNHNEAELFREANKFKAKYEKMEITKAEDKYIQMLGELGQNPDTTLTVEAVEEYYEEHKKQINNDKVQEVIKEARKDYDDLLVRVNKVLKEHGMQEIPHRKGYFPHFTEEKQGVLGKLFNWKTQNNDVPTDIAGMTESFNPTRSWQSFNKQRTGDDTVYSFMKGFDTYLQGALDWIYHIEDLQKRRAFENHIRYIHSEEGIKEQIEAIKNNEEYDADTAQKQIELVYANAKNPLNNFVTNFRTATNTLAGKKSSMDRGMEEDTNRRIYSTMTNISNRVSGNLIAGSISSAFTNFIPITQSWGQVSPISTLKAMKQTIASTHRDDGTINKSDFLTTRLRAPENLYKTAWDKIGSKVGWLMESIDSFTSQTVWRSKYIENIAKGMSENEAIKNADQFSANVIASRSRGDLPTIFDSKNPLVKVVTAFQVEVSNQYGYMLKDMPQDMAEETKAKLVKGYLRMFVGAYAFNALYSKFVGRDAAFDPIGIIEDVLKDLGVIGDDWMPVEILEALGLLDEDDEEEETDVADVFDAVGNFAKNVTEEIPYVGGLLGGGRIPVSSALPYDGHISEFWESTKGVASELNFDEGMSEFWTSAKEAVKSKNFKSLTRELLNPVYYLAMPMGGGQLRKTIQGLKMFDDDLPIAGSYTDSGKLRFPVDKTPGSVLQAAVFGQYANKNAREYFDEGYAPLKEKQVQEFKDLGLPIADYWKIREGQSKLKPEEGKKTVSTDQKAEYINSLNLPIDKKYVLKSYLYDEEEYKKDNPEKYAFLEKEGIGYIGYKELDEETQQSWSWAFKHQDEYRHLKENGVYPEDYSVYQVPMLDFDDEENKAYEWAFDYPEKASFGSVFNDGVKEYRKYTSKLYEIRADKDRKGKSISGSAKRKKKAYIWSLDIDEGAKYILFRNEYKSDDTYNGAIINYLLSRNDISYEDKKTILTELDFKIDSKGRITWN